MDSSFAEVVGLIEQARQRAYQAVNSELVGLYWRIGEYISAKLAAAVWGEGVVDSLAQHLARTMPGQRGFTRRNLFRMRQFYEAYSSADKRVTALLTQLPWTHNLIILTSPSAPRSESSTCAWRCRKSGRAASWSANSAWAHSSAPCSVQQKCRQR